MRNQAVGGTDLFRVPVGIAGLQAIENALHPALLVTDEIQGVAFDGAGHIEKPAADHSGPEHVDSLEAAAQRSPCGAEADAQQSRLRVERALLADSNKRVAFEVLEAPLNAEPGAPVSIFLAVRSAEGVVGGEMRVPREKWDLAKVLAALETEDS